MKTTLCIGGFGDSLDRLLIRCFEIVASSMLISQCFKHYVTGASTGCTLDNSSMQGVIRTFNASSVSACVGGSSASSYVEVPKGELYVSLVTVASSI